MTRPSIADAASPASLESDVERVTLCAWTRTVRYEGEWISVESYLERRYGVLTIHGISPAGETLLEGAGSSAISA